MLALWQGAPFGHLFISNSLVIGVVGGGRPEVRALNETTGAPVWVSRLSPKDPYILDVVPGDGVVMIEVAHCDPGSDVVDVSAGITIDVRTGRQLWTTSIAALSQNPPVAMSGDLVVMGDRSGTLTARKTRTGTEVWRKAPPLGCSLAAGRTPADEGVSIVADGPLLAASYRCEDGRSVVQRLAASTGRALWVWRSPGSFGSGLYTWLSVVGAASLGAGIFLSGNYTPTNSVENLVGVVPSYSWPASLGMPSAYKFLLVLDAATGNPRWTELGNAGLGYPFSMTFTLTGGLVCAAVSPGLECRDDVTGALSRPVIVTGHWAYNGTAQPGDRYAGITGSIAAVAMAPPNANQVALLVLPTHAGPDIAQASISLGAQLPPPPPAECAPRPCYDTMVVGAGPLPDGEALVLLRRLDLAGYPVLAIRLSIPIQTP